MAEIRATPLPQVGGNRNPVAERPVARRVNYGFSNQPADVSSSELNGLMQGLSHFNSALGGYTDQSIQASNAEFVKQDAELKKQAQAEAEALAQRTNLGNMPLDMAAAQDVPANVPLAYGNTFREALGASLVDRAAITAKADLVKEYDTERVKDGFDANNFLLGFRKKALAGLTDPAMVARMGKHLSDVEGAILSAAEKERMAKVEAEVDANIFTGMQESIRADMTPEEISQSYLMNRPQWSALGRTNKELAANLLSRLNYLSDAKGGDPSLFSVFDAKTDNGQTLLASNPELAGRVSAAREQAQAKVDKKLAEDANINNIKTGDDIQKILESDPGSINLDLVMQYAGKNKVFDTDEKAVHFLAEARRKAAEKAGQADLKAAILGGMLGRYKPEDQAKAFEQELGPAIDQAWQGAMTGHPEAATAIAVRALQLQSQAKSTVPIAALKRLVDSLSATEPGKEPDAHFQGVAAIYKVFSTDPKFRSMYFNDDTTAMMETYQDAIDNKSSPVDAYRQAYAVISPEAKQRAEAMAKSPDFQKVLKDAADSAIGDGWLPKWLGGVGDVGNRDYVQTEAMSAVKKQLAASPWLVNNKATVKQLMQSWVSSNFIMDETSNSTIRVPPGLADDTTKDAIASFSKAAIEKYNLKNRSDGEWSLQYLPQGRNGLMQVVATNGAAIEPLTTIHLNDIRQTFVATKSFSDAERADLLNLQRQVASGKIDPNVVADKYNLVEKARKLDGLPSDTLKKLDDAYKADIATKLKGVSRMDLGKPNLSDLQYIRQRGVKVDNKLTAQVALDHMNSPIGANGGYQSLAASLITVGEGVVTKASPDPAKDAGNNIGTGYNLKANAGNVKEDLKRAGVPADKVQDVIDGTAQLTPTQVRRLTMVAMPRYEKSAQDTAEKTMPGLWKRMTDGQKAVMVDLAWQLGSTDQYKKAWAALAKGDAEAFKNETKVFYTDRNGVKKEDTRRGGLRAAMMQGESTWLATVNHYGSLPGNALDAFALNNPK